jgi:hypothetical protein
MVVCRELSVRANESSIIGSKAPRPKAEAFKFSRKYLLPLETEPPFAEPVIPDEST